MTIGFQIGDEAFHKIYEVVNTSIDYSSPVDEHFVCRYCNETDSKKFRSIAHLLPEFTGNKEIFCYNECDDCNAKFGLYETNLNAFCGIKNTFIPIKGKKKFQKFRDEKSKFTTQFKEGNKVEMNLESNNKNFITYDNGKLNIQSTTQSFIPLYVYKSLIKFAISMIDKKDLNKFSKVIEWLSTPTKIHGEDENIMSLQLLHNESRPPLIKPVATLMKRKSDYLKNNIPEFTFIFAFGFHRFQIFLPYNSDDLNLLSKESIILPVHCQLFAQVQANSNKGAFKHYDMNMLEKRNIKDDFKVNIKPIKGDLNDLNT